jgi:hypothetical protein
MNVVCIPRYSFPKPKTLFDFKICSSIFLKVPIVRTERNISGNDICLFSIFSKILLNIVKELH